MRALEIYRRLAEHHEITLVSGLYPGAETEAEIDGIRLLRVGSARSYAASRLGFCLRAVEQLQKLDWDLWVNEFSAFAPLRVPAALRRRGLLFFQHFFEYEKQIGFLVYGLAISIKLLFAYFSINTYGSGKSSFICSNRFW